MQPFKERLYYSSIANSHLLPPPSSNDKYPNYPFWGIKLVELSPAMTSHEGKIWYKRLLLIDTFTKYLLHSIDPVGIHLDELLNSGVLLFVTCY